MSDWNDLLDRLTHPLRIDPELRREISRELLGHLEDSKAQFIDAGMTEPDARAAAIKAMGDEKEVAGQLWQANRRRVRVRRAVKWAAGVTLMPASAAVAVSMAWGAIVSIAVLLTAIGSSGYIIGSFRRPIAEHFNRKVLDELPPETRMILNTKMDGRDALAAAKSLADIHPGDPLYYANYANQCLRDIIIPYSRRAEIDPSKLNHVLTVLDRGKTVEPENGFYPFIKAALLFEISSKSLDDLPGKPPPGFDYVNASGKHEWWSPPRYQVSDALAFDRALAELHEAAGKPYIEAHTYDLVEQHVAALPPPRTLAEEVWRRERVGAISLPYLRFYAIMPAVGRAGELIQRGLSDRAKELARDCRKVAVSIAKHAHVVSDLIMARGVYIMTMGLEAVIDHQSGDIAGFDRNINAIRNEQVLSRDMWMNSIGQKMYDRAGMADRWFFGARAPENIDLAPARRADYALVDRLALSGLLVVLTLLAATAGIRTGMIRIKTRRWPALAFMGWRRLAVVVLASTLIPIGLYTLYALSPISGRERSAENQLERLAIEYATVACAIVMLLRTLSDRAMRKRAAELGATELRRKRAGKLTIALGLALAAGVVTFLVLTRNVGLSWRIEWLFPLLAVGLAAYTLSWLRTSAPDHASDPRSRARRIAPAASWGIVIGLLFAAGWILFSHPFSRDFESTIRASGFSIFAAIALLLLIRGINEMRRAGAAWSNQSFDYRLSLAPAILLCALVLSLIAGLPLKWQERRAVAAMNANGNAYSLTRELEESRWRALKERIQSKSPDL